MAACRNLTEHAQRTLESADPETNPMDILRTVVSAQGSTKLPTKPSLDEAVALTAIFPTIVAAAWRRSQGHEIVKPRADLGHAANLLWMMDGKEPSADRTRWLETVPGAAGRPRPERLHLRRASHRVDRQRPLLHRWSAPSAR